jgi:hypothetical protein
MKRQLGARLHAGRVPWRSPLPDAQRPRRRSKPRALAIEVGASIPAARVVRVLEYSLRSMGTAAARRLDNRPEFTAQIFTASCAAQHIELRFIQPGARSEATAPFSTYTSPHTSSHLSSHPSRTGAGDHRRVAAPRQRPLAARRARTHFTHGERGAIGSVRFQLGVSPRVSR